MATFPPPPRRCRAASFPQHGSKPRCVAISQALHLLGLSRRPCRPLGLGCERHLPCFGSMLLPHVPSPLRREENQGLVPARRPCSMAFPTKTVSRLLLCSRHRLPSGPFSRRFFRCSLCYGPRGGSPSSTDPTWRDIALRLPRTFPLPELSRGRSPFPRVGYRYSAPGGGHRDRTSPVGALPLSAPMLYVLRAPK